MKKAILLICVTLLATAVTAQSTLTKKEIKVLKKTHEISMLAVKIAELAPSHALNVETKAAAQRLMEDYQKVRQNVEQLAAKKNVALPTEICDKSRKIFNWYDKKQGKDFDKAYLKGASRINKGGACKINKLYKRTDDSDMKDWANQLRSTLEMHKTLLKQTCETVKNKK